MQRVVATSAVSATVDVLRDEILGRDDGDWLGSEDDLLDKLGVSRPTLRQAARLLEAEELLVVRRGLNGGLFARRPSTDAVARMASVYLRAEHTTVVDLARSWFVLLEQSAVLAAAHPDPAARSALVDQRAALREAIPTEDNETSFAATQALSLQLADLSQSPTLRLFTRVLSTLIADAPADLRPLKGVEQLDRDRDPSLELVAIAIRDGDGPRAGRCIREHGELLVEWLADHMPDRTV